MRNFSPNEFAGEGLHSQAFESDGCGVGFIAHLKGKKSHAILKDALLVLKRLAHRGACGCEVNTGDGAGVLLQVPHAFFAKVLKGTPVRLPEAGQYAVGMVSMPRASAEACRRLVNQKIEATGLAVLGWRKIPVNGSIIGPTAKAAEPVMEQVFVSRPAGLADELAYERRIYLARRRIENAIAASEIEGKKDFYIASLSARLCIYKGMLTSEQVDEYYPDLLDPDMVTALALVHSRFSTNTFPSWDLAHPFRMLAHNGEINTLRGNINWMHARESLGRSAHYTEQEMRDIFPVIQAGGSDSACLDNVLEFLVMCGYSLPHAVMMLIPEAWEQHTSMSASKKDFYAYHACLMEPWDGPASIAFTDGHMIGAVLDRNGLRPSRYYVTGDDLVIMASEVGVYDVEPSNVRIKGRLQPGRMFLVDMNEGRIVADEELKEKISGQKPYGDWLKTHLHTLDQLPPPPSVPEPDHDTVVERDILFGYTHEDRKILLAPMAEKGEEAIGSMGTDTPLAVLSNRPRMLYDYFKQLFAQVTNPPLDAIREELVTSVYTHIGAERNLLAPEPESCHQIRLKGPILDNEQMAQIKHLDSKGFRSKTLPMLFPKGSDGKGLDQALDDLCTAAEQAIADGYNIVILSDRGANENLVPIPALLATAGVHHHMVRAETRTRCGLVIETGEAREVHHFCLLVGFGASAVNPYLAFETLDDMIRTGELRNIDHHKAVKNYIKAVQKGIVKVMSKMGISTIQSYRGAQIFEAIGLSKEFVDKYFTWTATRISGAGLKEIASETERRHARAFTDRLGTRPDLDLGGEYQWRRGGEYHLFNPETVWRLQHSTRQKRFDIFQQYTKFVDEQARNLCTLRGLFEFASDRKPVPVEEVEPAANIMKRFATGAMSFGSISKEAHETLAIAMNRIGGKSNTGEGGEDPARFKRDPNGDWRRSAIKQVASGRFGVSSYYLTNAEELQIKMAQGAKPGEGGQLPGHKVDEVIARVRCSTPGVGLISPPPHHDIYSIEDLAQLIFDLKNSNPSARVSVKLVAEVGVGTVAAGVAKAHADHILISGHDGGTGASPLTSIKHAGAPWELGLAETQQVLVEQGLRGRVFVQADGSMKTGRDVVIAALLGAEEFGFATAPLVVSGCIMMRVCHLNTCPVGVATQDPVLRARFNGNADYVVNFFEFIAEEVRQHMARLGFRTLKEMIGHSDVLRMKGAIDHWKARGIDLSRILAQPKAPKGTPCFNVEKQDHGLDKVLDNKLIELAQPAILRGEKVRHELPIRNVDRATGTWLGHELTKKYDDKGLPDGTIHFRFTGSAGQSFGAFVPKGVTLELEGDANDYCGKGLSGGRIIVYPPKGSTFRPEENIIIGNVALYGATGGEAYFRGVAGERFCVRNSGVSAVIEGVGDHGCEYMTRGEVVVLGSTGRNFAAGMSGGVAWVLDEAGTFGSRCNQEMVGLSGFESGEDEASVKKLVEQHQKHTGSDVAARVLRDWASLRGKFVKVMPHDYRRVVEQRRAAAG
ncbi:MAG: glutamate synthase large subunit [Deltaproteobacteria bacterium]|nr:glutamate synthase large subunit [Deltaproteobacteria bacterium]